MNKLIVSAFLIAVAGCSSDSNNSTRATSTEYGIKLVNLTHGQPFSPPLALLHDGEFKAWETGTPASIDLEKLAEGGDAGALLASQEGKPNHISDSPLAPGQGISFSI
ncbi:MAG: spondin domain-containing protein, partial [Methylococcales bacterium]|nr:spondin domain-containing protein [Methylococcales bacterium]